MPRSANLSTVLIRVFLAIPWLCIGAFSQTPAIANFLPSGRPNAADLTISKRVDEVNLAFTVTDKRGHLINNLRTDDFTVLDNHVAPDAISFFQQQTDLPLRVAVLIDASDSIIYRFDYEKNAALMFLKRILRPGKDQAFVVAFSDKVRLVQDDTDDNKLLRKQVKQLKPGGSTALYDAVVFAANKLGQSSAQTRRAMILISDGQDTHSKAHLYEAEQAAVRAEVTVFALSTNEYPTTLNAAGEGVMDRLAGPTGGGILPARNDYHLARAFRLVEQTLRNQYALAYRPARFAPDGTFRTVEVFPARKGLKIQCRRGYFARREPTTSSRP